MCCWMPYTIFSCNCSVLVATGFWEISFQMGSEQIQCRTISSTNWTVAVFLFNSVRHHWCSGRFFSVQEGILPAFDWTQTGLIGPFPAKGAKLSFFADYLLLVRSWSSSRLRKCAPPHLISSNRYKISWFCWLLPVKIIYCSPDLGFPREVKIGWAPHVSLREMDQERMRSNKGGGYSVLHWPSYWSGSSSISPRLGTSLR